MKKRSLLMTFLSLALALSFFSLSLYAFEVANFNNQKVKDASDIQVFVNGEKLNFDTPPKLSEGRTLVPLRKITEALGYMVEYDPGLKKIVLKKGYQYFALIIENNFVWATEAGSYDNVPFALEVVPAIYQSRTYVPLRTIAELCAAKVTWDGKTRTIRIDAPKIPDKEMVSLEAPFDAVGRYSYQGQLKDGKPDGVGFMKYGYEFSSFYQGKWANGLPEGPGFMNLVTGLDNWSIIGEFSGGKLLNGTVTSSMGISFIRNGVVHSSFSQAGPMFWVAPKDESLNEAWQQTLITEMPKLK